MTVSGNFDGISRTLSSMASRLRETDIYSAAKLSCLLSCVNAVPLSGQTHNIHTLLIGSPGAGKAQMCRPLAKIIHPSVFIAGGGASAKEPTHNGDSAADQPVALVDTLADNRLVIVDKALSMLPDSLDGLNTVIDSQASVIDKGTEAEARIDVSVILTCIPPNGLRNLHSSIFDRLHAFGPSYLSRFNTFFVVPGARARKPLDDVYSDAQIAAYLEGARMRTPDPTPECDYVLERKLEEMRGGLFHGWFSGKTDPKYINQKAALRRNAGAFAKLLMHDTVDAECATLSAFMLECSIMSFRLANDEHHTAPHVVKTLIPADVASEAHEKGSEAALKNVREAIDGLKPLVAEVIEAIETPSGGGYALGETWETLQSLRGLLERSRNECTTVIERLLGRLGSTSEYYPYPPSEKVKDITPTIEDVRRARVSGVGDAGARALEALDRLPWHVAVAAMAIAESPNAIEERAGGRSPEEIQSLRRLVERARNECGELVEAAVARLWPSP